jgi:hypothetical protein
VPDASVQDAKLQSPAITANFEIVSPDRRLRQSFVDKLKLADEEKGRAVDRAVTRRFPEITVGPSAARSIFSTRR